MKKKVTKVPKFFKNPKGHLENVGEAIKSDVFKEAARGVPRDEAQVKRMPNYLQITQKRLNKMEVIDLKPYFRRSEHAKRKEDGGWYMRVPIRRKKSSMSRRNYEELRSVDISPNSKKTVYSKFLYDKRQVSSANLMNYQPRSNNITKERTGSNRHSYTSFRTVSDKSPLNSWIINRGKVNEEDTSKTFIRNVNNLMKWKLKNLS